MSPTIITAIGFFPPIGNNNIAEKFFPLAINNQMFIWYCTFTIQVVPEFTSMTNANTESNQTNVI